MAWPSSAQLRPLAPLCPWARRPRLGNQASPNVLLLHRQVAEQREASWEANSKHVPDVTSTPFLWGQMPGDPGLLTAECRWQTWHGLVSSHR